MSSNPCAQGFSNDATLGRPTSLVPDDSLAASMDLFASPSFPLNTDHMPMHRNDTLDSMQARIAWTRISIIVQMALDLLQDFDEEDDDDTGSGMDSEAKETRPKQ
jgi:hypothetical protein